MSATPDQGSCSELAGTVTCALGTIASGGSVDVVIVVGVPSDTAAGTITNNASVSTVTPDAVAGNDATSEDTTITTSADLSVAKVDSADPVDAGTGFSYTVTVANAGPSDAVAVSLIDVLPAEFSYVSASPDQGSCSELAGTVTCALGTIADGDSVDVVIAVAVPSGTAAGTITNSVSVSSATADPVAGNDATSEDTTIATSADVGVAKVDSADPVDAGTGFSYTVTVTNSGSSDATDVSLVDVLPPELTYISASPDQGSCGEVAGTVTCGLGTIVSGDSVDVVMAVAVPADAAAGTITNNASVSTTTLDPVAGNDAASEDTTITTSADLSVAKFDSADPVVAGAGLSYTVTVTNNGPSDAAAVSVVDLLPSEVSFVSATPDQGSCSELAGTVTCSLGTVASGDSVDVVIVVAVPSDAAAGTITNNASVSSATTDPVAGNDAASEDTTIATSADVSVLKIDSADPVMAGTGLSYTVTVSNAGPSDADVVSLVDVLPPEVTYVSATPDQGSCSESAGTVTCAIGTVASGDSVDVVITVAVPSSTAAGTITNNASVSSATSDAVAGNDATSEDTTISAEADLAVSKTDSSDPVVAGTGLSYTVTVANAGPSDATAVSLVDVLPPEVTYVSATPVQGSCAEAAGTVTCALGTVTAGGSVDVLVLVTVAADISPGSITNSASVSSATAEVDATDNATTEDTTVVASADVRVVKSDDPDGVLAGATLTYTVDVTNDGPSDAATVVATDVLPADVTFVSATVSGGAGTESCAEAGGVVSCALGTVDAGNTETATIVVTVGAGLSEGTVINNDVSVSSPTPDPDGSNNSDSEDTTVAGLADVSIVKSDSADPVNAGDPLTYTLLVANLGPGTAEAVSVVDVLPAGTAFVSAVVSGGSGTELCAEAGGTVTCTLGDVVMGVDETVTIQVTVDASTTAGTVLSNSAIVSSFTVDPVAVNDSDTELTTVSTSADVSIVKSDSADPVVAGTSFTYTLLLTNAGPSDATSVVVTDTLPAEVSYVSGTVSGGSGTETCTELGGVATCDLGLLDSGASEIISIVVAVDASMLDGSVLSNTASMTSDTGDADLSNNADTEDTTVVTSADLSVVKVDSADPVVAGTGLSYTVTVGNAGPSDAVAVSLVDVLPAEVSFVSATPDQGSCSEVAGAVTCALGSIADGDTVDVVIVVAVPSDAAAGTITNNASVSSATTDPVAGNDAASEDTTVTTSADLSVVKVDSADPVVAGTGLSYTVTVANAGPSDAVAVSLVDVLPAEVSFVSATPDQGSCSEVAGR